MLQLLEVDTKLGIIAGLAIAAKKQQEVQSEDEDTVTGGGSLADKRAESSRKTHRKPFRNGSAAHSGGGTHGSNGDESIASNSAAQLSSKKYSVHAQRDVIRKLQERNQILKQELSIESRDAKSMLGADKRQRLGYLHKMMATYNKKIELKNEMDSINKHLRAQIEKVRKDRVIFDGIYKKLEKEMSEYRHRHELSVEDLKKALDAKQQVNLEILQIQHDAEMEQRSYEQQFQELKALIETSMREAARLGGGPTSPLAMMNGSPFAMTKSSHASMGDESASLLKPGGAIGGPGVTENDYGKENPINRVSVLSTWKIGYDRALAATNESVVAKYDTAFAGIKQLTGIQDITKIADEIVSRDEANFKRFKRVEELNQEQVQLQTQVDELTAQIEAFKAQEGLATSASQKQQYRDMEQKFQSALEKSKAFDNEYEDITTTLTRVKSSVHSIHSMLVHANCARNVDKFSQGSAHLALGSHSARDVTDANVLEYLQAIETFTTSLMKETHDAAAAATAAESATRPPGQFVNDGPAAAQPGTTQQQAPDASLPPNHDTVTASTSPIGHGPPTLPSDPSQRLRVHVPSFGGANGAIIVPANSSFHNDLLHDGSEGSSGSSGSHKPVLQSSVKALQQQQQLQLQQQQMLQRRKSGTRFELLTRKSLSQLQFVAALAAAVTVNNDQPLDSLHDEAAENSTSSGRDGRHGITAVSAAKQVGSANQAVLEDDEEERALTYDELRAYAAKNVVKRKSGDGVANHNQQ
uniref:ODAD1 central coiled coil region domain-containing protein n=1 Tax=Globisporangium ultimum (strain ATCC 200006 / CBS 805.95 / DAOM BR144) TaxID=431595 RepID=K3WW00_GLOUD